MNVMYGLYIKGADNWFPWFPKPKLSTFLENIQVLYQGFSG